MRTVLLLTLLFTCYRGIAQPHKTTIPALPARGTSLHSFITQAWVLLDSAIGDLNKDGTQDMAFVLESKDSVTDYRYDGETICPLIIKAKVRVLALAFWDSATDSYRLALQENDFILRSDEGGCLGDPWNGLKIESGSLYMLFWGDCNYKWNLNYQFRYRSAEWQLIGATNLNYNHGIGGDEWSYNFLSGKAKHTILNGDESLKNKVEWYTINLKRLQTFKTLERPFTWQVFPDVFL